ncbi:MAG: KTSC domain-containing protein [Aestuariivita sp.]|nr:KTSC domain-containing protein [Aestuariivita sp.]
MIERYSVASSNVVPIGYDEQSQTLEIEFLNKSIYRYFNVPKKMYDKLMKEPSKGSFLHIYIKNAYPFSRVG